MIINKKLLLPHLLLLVLLNTFCATPEEQLRQLKARGYGWGTSHQGDDVVSREEAILQLKELIKSKKINVNAKEENEGTLLHFFILQKDIEMMKFVLEHGADVNATDHNGISPLHASINNLEMVKLLIKYGLDVNAKDKNGSTALHFAAYGGYLEVIKYLVEQHGADVNAKDTDGRTALTIQHNLQIMKYLVEHGADVNAKDNFGNTAFVNEAFFGSSEGMKYLIDKGANINIRPVEKLDDDETTTTILGMVIRRSYDFNKMKLLIEHGVDVNAKSKDGKTALIDASEKNNLEAVKYLVEHGANINTRYDNGKTALICNSEYGHLEIIKYLVKNKADVNAKDKNGKTALDFATDSKNLEIVVFLMPLMNKKK